MSKFVISMNYMLSSIKGDRHSQTRFCIIRLILYLNHNISGIFCIYFWFLLLLLYIISLLYIVAILSLVLVRVTK